MKRFKFSLFIVIFFIIVCLGYVSFNSVNVGISPEKLEYLYKNNEYLFKEVRDIMENKRIELKADYISIDDKPQEYKNSNYRIFTTFNENDYKLDYKRIEKVTDIFSIDEAVKIEKIFRMKFINIEDSKERCAFSEKGLLDCHNEILFTLEPQKVEEYAEQDDDEILKKFYDNWYIYGER